MALVNSTTVLMIGGEQHDVRYSSKTFFYSYDHWTNGPRLEIGREWHSCAMIKADISTPLYTVIVVGGASGGTWLSTVEVLSEDSRSWKDGPELPFGICCGSLVEDSFGGVILIGGFNGTYLNTLYHLANAKAEWVEMPQKLKSARSMSAAYLVPDELTNCTKEN